MPWEWKSASRSCHERGLCYFWWIPLCCTLNTSSTNKQFLASDAHQWVHLNTWYKWHYCSRHRNLSKKTRQIQRLSLCHIEKQCCTWSELGPSGIFWNKKIKLTEILLHKIDRVTEKLKSANYLFLHALLSKVVLYALVKWCCTHS